MEHTRFSDLEFKALGKYVKGAIVKPEDRWLIDKLYLIGLVRQDLTIDQESELATAAKLNPHGRWMYDRDKIARSPIRNLYYTFCALLE